MSTLLLLVVLLPLLLAGAIGAGGALRRAALPLAPWSPLPALVLSLRPGGVDAETLPWLLEGFRSGLDTTGAVFLFLTSLLWLLSGLSARRSLADDPRRARYFVFHLLTLTGNLGVTAAQDLVGFYLFFALMTFAGYGLVVHAATREALRAGRVYLVMAVIGETFLVSGLVLAGATASSLALPDVAAAVAEAPTRNAILGLLLAGFGVKAGALPLHVWLPLAHPVAPTPASAVLSGSMIKAGLLGWLRFLPLGAVALPGWSMALIALGLAAAFFGVAVGVTQRDAKTTLAYSSISQMGLLNVAVGVGLADPSAVPIALAACAAYAVHHGLAKGALFLGVGVMRGAGGRRERRLVLGGLAFAALAVAGAPLTSGALAKEYLKDAASLLPDRWPAVLDWLLPLAAAGTTLLMARFLALVRREQPDEQGHRAHPGILIPWILLLLCVAGVVWLLPHHFELGIDPPGLPYAGAVRMGIWPIAGGLFLGWSVLVALRRARFDASRLHVVPGDLLLAVEWILRRARGLMRRDAAPPPAPVVSLGSRWYGLYATSGRRDRALRMELALTGWRVAVVLVTALLVLLYLFLATGVGKP